MGRRAESLAARIEEGAARLADFAEGLSDAEWGTPASATDHRTVGQIVSQFVLEDHAVRHNWHHLARIRAALGR